MFIQPRSIPGPGGGGGVCDQSTRWKRTREELANAGVSIILQSNQSLFDTTICLFY